MRDASHRLTYEIYELDAEAYAATCKRIVNRFSLRPKTELVIGLDEMFRDYSDGTLTIGLEWDNWSGFTVVAKQTDAEPLVQLIERFLSRDGSC